MTTTTTYFARLDALHPNLGTLVREVAAQAFEPATADRLAERVKPSGKLSGTRAPKEKKPVPMTEKSALTGADHYVRPNGDKYFTRKWGDHDDVNVLREARTSGIYTMLYGEPGTGKTALVEAAFASTGERVHTVIGSGDTEVADLVGGYVQTPGGGFLWEDGPLLKAAEHGEVLFIDEVGLIDTKVLAVVYGLMDGRREYTVTANPERGTVRAKDGFYVVAATNPNAPGVRLSEALLSRFLIQVEMTTDWGLARKLGVPTQMVTIAQNLSKKRAANEVSWAPQMRELLGFRDVDKLFGTKFAVANLLAAAPEIDRPIVADVFSRVLGETCLPAKI